jgi:hypothetical protein
MARAAWWLLRLVLLAGPVSGMACLDEGSLGTLVIQLAEQRLTVHAEKMPHHWILKELARRLHFERVHTGPLEQPRDGSRRVARMGASQSPPGKPCRYLPPTARHSMG